MTPHNIRPEGLQKMSERNPIYQAMVRTRIIFKMMRDFEQSSGTKALFDQFHNEMSVIRNLHERGAMSSDAYRETSLLAGRSIHAAAINHWRKQARLIDRRRMPRALRDADHSRVRVRSA